MNELTIFGLERLEDRVLLAVNIKQSGGTLTITGSGEDETIHIHNYDGGVRVRVDDDGDGAEDFYADYFGVVNIKIDTKGGDDHVDASDLSIGGTLDIKTGAGYDQVHIGPYSDPFSNGYYGGVSIGKDLKIDTGSDDDEVYVGAYDAYDTDIGGKLEIKTQGGDDDVYVRAINGATLDVDKDVKIDTGGGEDEVHVNPLNYSEIDIDGTLEIKTGADDDAVFVGAEGFLYVGKDLRIDTGPGSSSGDDFVTLLARSSGQSYGLLEVDGSVHINTHNGDDAVFVRAFNEGEIDVGKDLDIHTGGDAGDDFVQLVAFNDGRIEVGRHLNVHTHNGDDGVFVVVGGEASQIAVFDSTHIDLGNAGPEGDVFQALSAFDGGSIDFYDQFHLHQHNGGSTVYADEYVTFHDDASFDGGNNYDYIDVFDATFLGDLKIEHFENYP
jgi:hypothetical protein